jgi:hypothetical protein
LLPSASAEADRLTLEHGVAHDGLILDINRNTVMLRGRGGIRAFSRAAVERIEIDLDAGGSVAGELLGWEDGIFSIRTEDGVVQVKERRVLTTAETDPPMPAPAAPRPAQVLMAGAPTLGLQDGRTLIGEIIHATGSIVTIRQAGGGVLPTSRAQIETVTIQTGDGRQITGGFLGWEEGVYRLQVDGQELLAVTGEIRGENAPDLQPSALRRTNGITAPPRLLGPGSWPTPGTIKGGPAAAGVVSYAPAPPAEIARLQARADPLPGGCSYRFSTFPGDGRRSAPCDPGNLREQDL